MNKRVHTKHRLFCIFLLSVMVVCMAFSMPVSAESVESNVTKLEKTYDIAVVFDNSGSMYFDESWCRAKYAMEIFASMLNYEKDKLHIFPMWEVTTDGSKPASDSGKGSYAPIEISSKDDIDKISNMFSVKPWSTPFAPITEAHEYLKKSVADERWLIVLTDGVFDENARDEKASINLQVKLPELASREIKVQYLGFGGASKLNADEANNFFAKSTSGEDLKNDLVDICNRIFQRSVLPSDRLNGQILNLDLSMKNIIVFAQGPNAKITGLKDSAGKQVNVSLDSGQRKYSKISANAYKGSPYDKAPFDDSLAGQVVTFTGCPKGKYTLSYSNVESIQIFYEPDVDLEIIIRNSDGVEITKPEDFVAGDYTISSRLIDPATGEDVTSHELLGNGVTLKTKVKTSKDSDYKEYDNGAKITFEPDDDTSIIVEGTYLDKYKISSESDPRFDWIRELKVKSVDFKINVSGQDDWYVLKEHDDWKPIKVDMTIDGKPLTDEELARTEIVVDGADNLKYKVEPIPGESACYIYLAKDEDGKYVEPDTGEYKLDISAVHTDEDGEKVPSNKEDVAFEIQRYSKIWRILFWVLIGLLFLLLVAAWLLHPVLPKCIYIDGKRTTITKGSVKAKCKHDISQIAFSGNAKVIWSFRNAWIQRFLKSSRQTFTLADVTPRNINEMTIDGICGISQGGRLVDPTQNEKISFTVGNSNISWTEIEDDGNGGYILHPFSGEIKVNKKK